MIRGGVIDVPKDLQANIRWRQKALVYGNRSFKAAAEMRRQCANDILFYANTFGFTYDPRKDEKVIPFITYQFQDDAILRLVEDIKCGRDVGIMKSRDMGASWIILLVLQWMWQFHAMNSFLVVSRNEDYVDAPNDPKSLFWKIDFLLEHQPSWLRPKGVKRTSLHIGNLENGSVIDGESTTGEVGRGDRRTAIMMDEFAAFETKSGFNALASTQSATRCRIFNSTPKGSENAFAKVIKESAADIITMHWSAHPEKRIGLYQGVITEKTKLMECKLLDGWKGIAEVRTKGERGVKKVAFPEDYPFILDGKKRSIWYDLECSRAVTQTEIGQELDIDFLGSDYQFFDTAAIAKYKAEICREPKERGDFVVRDDMLEVIEFRPNEKGCMALWEMPRPGDGRWDENRRFVMGVDVSAGTGASNSTIAVYDLKSKEKVAEYANPKILPDDFGRYVVAMAKFFNEAKVVPDRSGPTGEVLVRRMLAEGYTNIYRRKNMKKIGTPTTDEHGVWLNVQMKTTCLQNYRDAIGHCKILNLSERALDECLRFICKMDGSIEHSSSANANDPSGARANHGDIVIADALATIVLSEDFLEEATPKVVTPEGSLAWRMEVDRKARSDERRARSRFLPKGWKV